jgi:hypothetical protein
MIDKIKEELSNADLLAKVVGWDTHGVDIEDHLIRSAIERYGLGDPEKLCPDLSKKSAFLRGVKELKKDRLIQQVVRDGDVMRFQMTKQDNDGEKITHTRECVLTLDLETGAVYSNDSPEMAELCQKLLREAMRTRNAADLNRMIQRLFNSQHGLYPVIKRKGGLYFVTAPDFEFLERAEAFMVEIGAEFHCIPVPRGSKKGNRSVKQAISKELEALVADLDLNRKKWDGKTREATIRNAQSELDTIEFRMKALNAYLGDTQRQIEEKIKSSREELAKSLFSKQAQKLAEKEAKKSQKPVA